MTTPTLESCARALFNVTKTTLTGTAHTWESAPETVRENHRVAAAAVLATFALGLDGTLETLWDNGNASGLDGWIGPGRGSEHYHRDTIGMRERDVQDTLREITQEITG
ncbi:hypothetical protein SEA_HIBISCUS_53 [Gordonia phage Hibiscus]